MLPKRICGSIGATALPRRKATGLAPTVTPASYVAKRADCHVDATTWSMLCGPAVLADTCPLLLSLTGGGLVSARQPARAAPAARLGWPLPACACRPSACVPPPQHGHGRALVHRWALVPSAQGVHSSLHCGTIAFELSICSSEDTEVCDDRSTCDVARA